MLQKKSETKTFSVTNKLGCNKLDFCVLIRKIIKVPDFKQYRIPNLEGAGIYLHPPLHVSTALNLSLASKVLHLPRSIKHWIYEDV